MSIYDGAECEIEGCHRRPWARSFCQSHYGTLSRANDPRWVANAPDRTRKPCAFDECIRVAECGGYCKAHYQQSRNRKKGMRPLPNGICVVCGAEYEGDPRRIYCDDCQRFRGNKKSMNRIAYETLLAAQGGRCAICDSPTPTGRGGFHIDHDHSCCPGSKTCGQCNRGLLCSKCNTGLGQFGDNVKTLQAAAAYINQWAS